MAATKRGVGSGKWRRPSYAGQVRGACFVLVLGVLPILYGAWSTYHDRPSLQWPKVSGQILQAERRYISRPRNSYYHLVISYAYGVNDQRYLGNQFALWDTDWYIDRDTVLAFLAAHPVHSTVDVFYDPRDPQNAVLVPGADEPRNRLFIWCGTLMAALSVYLFVRARQDAPRHGAAIRVSPVAPEKPAELPHGFVTYEPGNKRKLNCFPDRDCLLEALGHNGPKVQDWTPADRVIDTAGCEYRLVARPDKKSYDYEPTGETWNWEKLLDVAVADAQLLRKDPEVLRRKVYDAPPEKKLAVLMKCVDDLPTGPRWVMIGFVLFLVLFFLIVVLVAGTVINWLLKWF
ncbi:MAG TPA: DUF3592 domain-containing protein [Verrucomicrobiae bacterium]|nr:DUF3592 domain-containing protein [Verrucomicrobiae bacterium]